MISHTDSRLPIALFISALALVFALAALAPSVSAAALPPKWRIESLSNTTAAPGGTLDYIVQINNVGEEVTDGSEISLLATLPTGLTATSAKLLDRTLKPVATCLAGDGVSPVAGADSVLCNKNTQKLSGFNSAAATRNFLKLYLTVEVAAGPDATLTSRFEVSGGGAAPASTVDPVARTATPPSFGIDGFDLQSRANSAGAAQTQAGGHPYDLTVPINFNTLTSPSPARGIIWPVEATKDIAVELPEGLVGNPTNSDQCTLEQLANGDGFSPRTLCTPAAQVGTTLILQRGGTSRSMIGPYPVYNMVPPPGVPARFGFNVAGSIITLDAELRNAGDYGLTVNVKNIPQAIAVSGALTTFWGLPAAADHDLERACPGVPPPSEGGAICGSGAAEVPFFRYPTSCATSNEGLPVSLRIDSWVNPGSFVERTIRTHQPDGYPATPAEWGPAAGPVGCEEVPVRGSLDATPTSRDASTPSGLAVHFEVPNPGFDSPTGIASSDIKKVKVQLPQGITVNPSQAEGLGACAPGQYASTELSFYPTDKGCPEDSKIGTVEVHTPLIDETIPGTVYIAQPFDNPFGSLLALYVVLAEPQRGILVKLAGKVDTDPVTGQITATFDDLPQLPFSTFDFKFREGSRAPLVTPQSCGKYTTHAEFTGWSDPSGHIDSNSSFQITRGIGGAACPSGGLPPFKPGLLAGTRNNNAGSYSPFDLRLFRTDAEQEFTNFSIKLPPGLTGKLAGIPFCADAAIAAAKDPDRTGAQELASPSCPAASEVGRTLVGAGVGPVLTYVPGKIYLAGPYNGSALSIAAITAAKVGPFDLGTVVVRQALKINPDTAEVFIDATGSDPLPHIIDGVTTHLRDIRAYVDKPEFTLNPTSCDPTSTASTVLGSGLDFASAADDVPVTVTSRFQAANCASLGFKPKLALSLKGGTRRGQHPSLKAVLTARKGDANIAKAKVTLPHSEFLAQSHIRTICTRVQYNAGAVPGEKCPPASIYGYAKAITPLLDEPIEGPVFLRSSANPLPDLVASLHSGKIDINLVGRIDSVGKDGQIRNSFEAVPDAPVTRFTLTMQGGKKGLLENSTNLCRKKNRAIAKFDGQNGKVHDFKPVLKVKCAKRAKKKG